MKFMRLVQTLLIVKSAFSLPDFSHIVSENARKPSDEWRYGPFFGLYDGVPPASEYTAAPAPTYHAPTPHRTDAPIAAPIDDGSYGEQGPNWITRTAFYQYQWGAISKGCTYKAPRSLVKCLGGGVLVIRDKSNVDCELLSIDIAQCSQIDQENDAILDFQCIGNTPTQLAANARTLPSAATECNDFDGFNYGGNAVAAASLGRYCSEPGSDLVSLDSTFPCVEGTAGEQNGDIFCASPSHCFGVDCTTYIEPLSITAYTEELTCSTPELQRDLTDFNFSPSTLASFHVVKWTFSDLVFGCEWEVPDLEVKCRNGGLVQLVEDNAFCHKSSESDIIVCTNPDPTSEDGRINVDLEFWCYGNIAEQLAIEVTTMDADTRGFSCAPEGLLVQGIEVARACGEFQSDSFLFFSSPSFCKDPTQYHQEICFAGFTCPVGGDGCLDVELDSVSVDTTDLIVGSCIYAQ